jgi:DNA-binding MarR family transcriptional regulator
MSVIVPRISLAGQVEQGTTYSLGILYGNKPVPPQKVCNQSNITPAQLAQRAKKADAWVRQLVVTTNNLSAERAVMATPNLAKPTDLAIAEDLGYQLIRLINMITRAKAQFTAAATQGIERAAYALLAHLVREGPQRTTALAEAVHSDTSTVSRQVSALVQHGLVERKADPQDGRACLLVATEAGRTSFDQARAARTEHIARVLAEWPQSDRRTLVMLLDRFNDNFENYHPVGETR